MSDTLRNPQNGGINPKPVSNYQSILSKNAPSNGQKNIYRNFFEKLYHIPLIQ